jgi:hypothetical protein
MLAVTWDPQVLKAQMRGGEGKQHAYRQPIPAPCGEKEIEDMRFTVLVAGLCISVTPVASGQASAQTTQTETKYTTIDGEVVRYEAGRVIVIRGADNKEITYTLSPSVVVPAEVNVGRRVMLYTEPGKDGGTQLVSRVTTTSITSDGNVKRTTEDTRTLPSGATPARPPLASPGRSRPTKRARLSPSHGPMGARLPTSSTRSRWCRQIW